MTITDSIKRRDRRGQENLDVRITLLPRGYLLAFVCLCIVACVIVVWGFYGSVPTKALGNGLIQRVGQQVLAIQSKGAGRIRKINVVAGDLVESGMVLARLDQLNLDTQITATRQAIDDLELELRKFQDRQSKDIERHRQNTSRTTTLISQTIDELIKGRNEVIKLLDSDASLLKGGLISRSKELDSRISYQSIITQIGDLRIKKDAAEQALQDLISTSANLIDEAKEKINLQRRKLDRLLVLSKTERTVQAPISGRVQEVRVGVGQNVSVDDILITIGHGGSGFEAVAFLAPEQARRVSTGMLAHVIPSSASKAEFGSIRGEVTFVSAEPVSQADANNIFQNAQLAARLASSGGVFLARVRLEGDTDTKSGFKWWSGTGPNFKIKTGTLTDVEILVREQPPVSLIVPALRSFLGD